MPTLWNEFKHIRAHAAASGEILDWINGANSLALLSGAIDSGIVDALRVPMTPDQIAAATNLDQEHVADVCLALEARGIIRHDGDRYRLTPEMGLLTSPDVALPLSSLLSRAQITIRTLQATESSTADYTKLDAEHVLAMAESSGASATSAARHIPQILLSHVVPEVRARWLAGAHHAEVGCGVGNSLLGTVIDFPKVTTVGIEIEEITSRETQRRAVLLGVSDRVEVRHMDACDLQDEAVFDTMQWSQP